MLQGYSVETTQRAFLMQEGPVGVKLLTVAVSVLHYIHGATQIHERNCRVYCAADQSSSSHYYGQSGVRENGQDWTADIQIFNKNILTVGFSRLIKQIKYDAREFEFAIGCYS